MISKDVPCKTCGHAAIKHYANISNGEHVCITCEADYDERVTRDGDQFHQFEGDNLKYLELLNRREQIRNEQA